MSYGSQILFPVSSLKDEENGITKSATGNNKSKYISSKWEEELMNLSRLAGYIRDHGIRGSVVLTADRILGRKRQEVSYDQWLSRNRPSSADYLRMEENCPADIPMIGVSACMPPADRSAFFQSLNMQVYRGFRALKNCPEAAYILLAAGPCTLRPELLWECASLVGKFPAEKTGLIYFDSDTIGADGRKCRPAFRPDFDPELLERVNYMGSVVLVRADLACTKGLPSRGEDEFHRFLKRVCLQAGESGGVRQSVPVAHIPKILYHCAETSLCDQVIEDDSGKDRGPEPLISVLIPNRDHGEDLERCVESLLTVNTWNNLEILILENNSEEEETDALYRKLQERDGRIRVLKWDGPFNYSAINNFGALHAGGEYLLLLNNDTKVLEPESIARMQRLASLPETGAVGALLYYPDMSVQHAGIILGHGGIAGHAWEGERPMENADPFRKLVFSHTHNVSAVTGACMMVRKSVWNPAGGMDETLEVTFNDVDLCLRLRREGLRVLLCPGARLIHYESASRGSEDTPEKVERFHSEIRTFVHRWEDELEKGDPFYNPNLTLTGRSWTCRDDLRETAKPYRDYLNL